MPRNPTKDIQQREERKRQILKAALPLFVEKGFLATSMNDIAKAAGMSKALIYNYFESKEEIYSVLAADIVGVSEKDAQHLLYEMDGTPWDRLCRLATDAVIHNSSKIGGEEGVGIQFNLALSLQFLNFNQLPEPFKNNIDKAYMFNKNTLAELIKQGQARGQLVEGNPYQLAIHYSSIVSGMIIENTRNEAYFTEGSVRDGLKLFLLD